MLINCPDRYKTQKTSNGAVDDCLEALKFTHNWFVTSEMLEKFYEFYLLMMIYSFLIKVLVKSHFLLMKWVFLV